MPRFGRSLAAAGLAVGMISAGIAAPASATTRTDHTSIQESQRVDRVPTPELDWYQCYGQAECARAWLPLDYDRPEGATTVVSVVRVKAKDQEHKIGSLFINPGGPGGSGTDIALNAPYFLSPSLLERFDIVGFDPRGIQNSDRLHCWESVKDQSATLKKMNIAFPWGEQEEAKYIEGAKEFGKACSTTGKPLSGAVSTAEAARDMDVLRRAVGDEKLTYLGFSYGTALGQYYANMFPDRFRAIALDGVIDPQHWIGTTQTANEEQDARMRSADGAYRALQEILQRCDAAGEKYCPFAAGDPVKNFDLIAQELRRKPLVVTDPYGSYTITYADFVGNILKNMYSLFAGDIIVRNAQTIWTLLNPPSAAAKAAAEKALITTIRDARAEAANKPTRDFPYNNTEEAFAGVTCTDALHPQNADQWPALMAQADERAPYFGRAWGWQTAPCARQTWTVRDEDAYTGPWNRSTAAPVLFLGAKWDPATNYDEAVSASQRLSNSRLLSSDNWGHTSYGISACATDSLNDYLLTVKLPAEGTLCQDSYQPFLNPLPDSTGATASPLPTTAVPNRPQTDGPPMPSILNGTR